MLFIELIPQLNACMPCQVPALPKHARRSLDLAIAATHRGAPLTRLFSLGSDAIDARQDAVPHGQWQKNPTGASGNLPRIIAGRSMSS